MHTEQSYTMVSFETATEAGFLYIMGQIIEGI